MAQGGFLRVVGEAELQATEAAEIASAEEEREQEFDVSFTSALAHHVRTMYYEFRRHRTTRNIQRRLMHALNAYNGQYDAQKLQEIKNFGGSDVYARLTAIKCRGATALLRDVYLSGERPWKLDPTPVPEVPGDIRAQIDMLLSSEVQNLLQNGQEPDQKMVEERRKQLIKSADEAAMKEARDKAKAATRHVEDRLAEGDFYGAFAEFLIDLPIFPFAVLKGPVFMNERTLVWENGRPVMSVEPKMFWKRISPFDIYWTPAAGSLAEADVIERSRLRRSDLQALIGVEGYDDDAIEQALDDYTSGLYDNLDDLDTERADAEDKENPHLNRSAMIDCLELQGEVPGRYLQTWNGGKAVQGIEDFNEKFDYNVTCFVVGRHCIKAKVSPNPRLRHNYFSTSFEKVAGAMVGRALPEILGDSQHVANAAFRSLVNNMGMACLTGDTVVYRHGQDRALCSVTLKELWDKKHEHNSGLRRMRLRCLDEETGEFFGNRVHDVFDNGVHDVFEVVTRNGYRIKATGNHRFMREDGDWQELDDFDVGDLMAVNGSVSPLPSICVECGGAKQSAKGLRCRSCASKAHNSSWNQKQVELARENRDANGTTARRRFECRAAKLDFCQDCGASERLHVHHVDRDPWNNALENLRTLCEPCHKQRHTREDSLGDPWRHRYVTYDAIVSITWVGREQVFDLQMVGTNKNFVANGFVSHNSGPQVAINEDRMSPTMTSDALYPWKRWRFQSDPLGSSEKPIDFFQPNSNAQELLGVFEKMMNLSDEVSGIPRYMTGNQNVSGAASTASGLNQLMSNASKIMQQVASQIDREIIEPVLQALYEMVLLTDESGATWGDMNVRAAGVTMAIARDADRQRQLEFLQLTANPLDQGLVGPKGRAVILRELADNLGLDGEAIIPSEEELKQQEEQQRAMQAQQSQQEQAAQAQGAQPQAPGASDQRPNRGLDNQMRTRTPQAIANQATP